MRWRGDNASVARASRARREARRPSRSSIWLISFALSHPVARDAEPFLEETARRAEARADAAGAVLAGALAAQMRHLEPARAPRTEAVQLAEERLAAARGEGRSCRARRDLVRARPRLLPVRRSLRVRWRMRPRPRAGTRPSSGGRILAPSSSGRVGLLLRAHGRSARFWQLLDRTCGRRRDRPAALDRCSP